MIVCSVNRSTLAHTNFSCDFLFNSSAKVNDSVFVATGEGLCRYGPSVSDLEGMKKVTTCVMDYGTHHLKRPRFFSFFGKVNGHVRIVFRDVPGGEELFSKQMTFAHTIPCWVEISVPRTFFRRSWVVEISMPEEGWFFIDKLSAHLIVRPSRLSEQR